MDMDFHALMQQCAPEVHPETMAKVVRVESSFNPYAIGVVGGALERQPRTKEEAIVTAQALDKAGWNFSVGIGQVNKYNLPKFGLPLTEAFDSCKNLAVGAKILSDCYQRASSAGITPGQPALEAAFSCYYSGNFRRGFVPDAPGQPSYVQKVLASAGQEAKPIVAQEAKPIAVVPATGKPATTNGIARPADAQGVKTRPTRIPAKYDGFSNEPETNGFAEPTKS